MRIALRLDPEVRLLPCVSIDRTSVRDTLLELLQNILIELQ